MSLRVKIEKIQLPSLEDENTMDNYYLVFDMKSMEYFSTNFNQPVLQAISGMQDNMDENVLIKLFASCVRENLGDEPLGISIFEELQLNPLAVITEYSEKLLDVVVSSLPKNNGKKKVSKRK